MSTARIASSEASIQSGREAYEQGRLKEAVEHFTLVANRCPCNRGGRRERCKCKDFDKIISEKGDVFREAMHTCSCGVAQKYNKCHETEHIQALDYRSAALYKVGRADHSKRDAEWLLEMAPRALEGYLRLSQIYRLRKETDLLRGILEAGVRVGHAEGLAGTSKYKRMVEASSAFKRQHARIDPMSLPSDLLLEIFGYFSTVELCRVQRVSRSWRRFFEYEPLLWQDIHVPGRMRPSYPWLKELPRKTKGRTRTLSWRLPAKFPEHSARLLLLATSFVKKVEIDVHHDDTFAKALKDANRTWRQIRAIRVANITHPAEQAKDWIPQLLENNSHTLEYIFLHSHGIQDDQLRRPRPYPLSEKRTTFPQLRFLGLDSVHLEPAQFLTDLPSRTPALQELYVGGDNCQLLASTQGNNVEASFWSDMRSVCFGPRLGFVHSRNVPAPDFIWPRMSRLRCFEATGPGVTWNSYYPFFPGLLYHRMADGHVPLLEEGSCHPHLERFWVSKEPYPYSRWPCLEKALANGTLSELGLKFPDWRDDESLTTVTPAQHLIEKISCFKGARGLRKLGLFDFDLNSGLMPGQPDRRADRDQGRVMMDFIASFPELDALMMWTTHCEGVALATLVERIARQGQIKKFCCEGISGATLDQLRRLLRSLGAEFVDAGYFERRSYLDPPGDLWDYRFDPK